MDIDFSEINRSWLDKPQYGAMLNYVPKLDWDASVNVEVIAEQVFRLYHSILTQTFVHN